MAEVDWGTEDNQAKSKRRVPTWVWIGGGCCGVAVLAVVALTIGGAIVGRKMMNQDANWESLSEVVPLDEEAKREDAMIMSFPFVKIAPGIEGFWQINEHHQAWQAVFQQYSGEGADEVQTEVFDKEGSTMAAELAGAFSEHDTEIGTIAIQGRTLRCRRFVTEKDEGQAKKPEAGARKGVMQAFADAFEKSVAIVDITPEGTSGLVLFVYAKLGSLDRMPDSEVIEFLRPYHIGPTR